MPEVAGGQRDAGRRARLGTLAAPLPAQRLPINNRSHTRHCVHLAPCAQTMDGVTAEELEKAKVIEAPTPTSVRSLDAPVMVLDTHDAIYVWLESSVPVDGASSGQPGYLGSALEDELQERKDGRNPQPQLFVYHGAVHARPVFSALLPDMEAFVADTIVQAEASIASAMERVDEYKKQLEQAREAAESEGCALC